PKASAGTDATDVRAGVMDGCRYRRRRSSSRVIPVVLRMLPRVPRFIGRLPWTGTGMASGISGCLSTWWLPRTRLTYQPRASSALMSWRPVRSEVVRSPADRDQLALHGRDRQSVFLHRFDVELDGFFRHCQRLIDCLALGGDARQLWDEHAVATLVFR